MTVSSLLRDLPLNVRSVVFPAVALLYFSAGQAVAGYANGDTRGANLLGSVPNVVSVDPTAGSAGMAYTLEKSLLSLAL